jgi:hypothetical protein
MENIFPIPISQFKRISTEKLPTKMNQAIETWVPILTIPRGLVPSERGNSE